jgi:uncharacterized protein (UPF0548 family)
MMFVKRPPAAVLDRLLAEARSATPTFSEAFGYRHDLDEVRLGNDEGVFDRAVSAVRSWQAQLGAGVEVHPSSSTVADGETVLLLIHAAGLWTVAPCRIVSVDDGPDRFAFAYATLPGHPERGEATFVVQRDADGVVFRVESSSRPVALLPRLARPLTRRIQRRVTLEYLASIERAARVA